MEYNHLFCQFQSAYHIGHSCETALTCIHNDLLSGDCYDCKQHQSNLHNSLLMLLDLSAAFDTLNHNQLLFVLKNTYGLNHKILEWLHSYLDLRTFSVIAAGSQSQVHNLDVCVP